MAVIEPDGRRFRRAQNREAVLDALIELFREGNFQPAANDIAQRAGISARSLFRYFEDVQDLSRAAIARHMAAAGPLYALAIPADAPLDARIDGLAEARINLFEAIAPTARAVRIAAHHNALLASQLRERRSFFRRQVGDLFAAELQGLRAGLLPALDTLCSFETYDLLCVDHGLSRSRLKSALVTALTRLLQP